MKIWKKNYLKNRLRCDTARQEKYNQQKINKRKIVKQNFEVTLIKRQNTFLTLILSNKEIVPLKEQVTTIRRKKNQIKMCHNKHLHTQRSE